MRLSNFRIPAAIVGLTLLADTVAVSDSLVPGGNEADGTIQYVCRAPYNSGLHPGKTVGGNCNFGFGGREIVVGIPPASYFRVSYSVNWVSSSSGQPLPPRPIQVGYEADNTPLYSCRAFYNSGWHLGKTVAGNCNFGFGGREILARSYQVLVRR